MGMQFKLEQVTPLQLENFIRDPDNFYVGVMSDSSRNSGVAEFLAMAARQRQSLPAEARANLDRLASMLPATSKQNAGGGLKLLRKMAQPKREEPQPAERKQFSLEKDWHVLHY